MYKKTMVPPDGSELAECVLRHVEGFVGECDTSEVTLVRVVESESVAPYRGGIPVDAKIVAEIELSFVASKSNLTAGRKRKLR